MAQIEALKGDITKLEVDAIINKEKRSKPPLEIYFLFF